jgi:general L-amino acid transport system permease protein
VSAQPQPAVIPVEADDGTTQLVPIEQARAQDLLNAEDELLYATSPLYYTRPVPQGLRFIGGMELSENYLALLISLVIYTAAFIAEIVRAGILAVPRGQIEASRALGLTYSQMLRMVVLPQALRVIIPPLGNQYLNLSKNSSLALAIAYADVFAVTYTIINQSGQSVTGIVMIMLAYLVISLLIAAVMNWVNGRFQLKTR